MCTDTHQVVSGGNYHHLSIQLTGIFLFRAAAEKLKTGLRFSGFRLKSLRNKDGTTVLTLPCPQYLGYVPPWHLFCTVRASLDIVPTTNYFATVCLYVWICRAVTRSRSIRTSAALHAYVCSVHFTAPRRSKADVSIPGLVSIPTDIFEEQ